MIRFDLIRASAESALIVSLRQHTFTMFEDYGRGRSCFRVGPHKLVIRPLAGYPTPATPSISSRHPPETDSPRLEHLSSTTSRSRTPTLESTSVCGRIVAPHHGDWIDRVWSVSRANGRRPVSWGIAFPATLSKLNLASTPQQAKRDPLRED
jgi:hypothetical protein